MSRRGIARLLCGLFAVACAVPLSLPAKAQDKVIKIGVVYDLTGPFAGGGSELQYLGAKIVIDWFNAHGGIDGYKVQPIYADAQSKPDVAINEAVRLIEQEKVDMLLGFYASAECVPVAARVEQFKKFMWITTCIASPVLEGRNLQYVFRPQPFGTQWGLASTAMVAAYSKEQLGKDPKDLRVAIVHEDGPYGTDVAKGNAMGSKTAGFQVVLNEGYSSSAPDLSSLVTKLKRGRPDVIFHTGYNPDITLFLRQARELGLRFDALIGQGAGYTVYSKLKETVGNDANYFFDVDPISIWQSNPASLKPDLPPLIKLIGEEYMKAKPDTVIKSAHVGMAASNTYLFLTDVLPRAIKKYGGITSDDLRQAAMDTDVADGGTMLGFGVKFEGQGAPMEGQNERAYPVIVQYIDDKAHVVWPKAQAEQPPVLKLPASSPYAMR
ncbi:MAG TPA: ABC transporter substrate-binding protein [Acetobacteraceae bacterium]|jgi:ABC-type branched-subunit amino acid transport system substrate-binding protein|nr:ABC transporter substrate-binding protein [Acetobacteraceae bacterium]